MRYSISPSLARSPQHARLATPTDQILSFFAAAFTLLSRRYGRLLVILVQVPSDFRLVRHQTALIAVKLVQPRTRFLSVRKILARRRGAFAAHQSRRLSGRQRGVE
jgi:hypothetical protein